VATRNLDRGRPFEGLNKVSQNKNPAGSAAMRKPKDATQSRAEILAAAIQEFATRGLEGARVDAIAKRTRTTRAMIYYYFGSKAGLYLAVLEHAYRGIREAEKKLDLAHLPPVEAMRCLVAFTFDYYQEHPSFVALVIAENQAGGRYIRRVTRMHRLNASIIGLISDVLARGVRERVFRAGVDPIDVHMTIASLGLFQIANRHTFGYVFGRDLAAPRQIKRNKELVTEIVLRFAAAHTAKDGKRTAVTSTRS
jgi:AcrR family transcriptional regulator